jgi:excisionase family DNA binding protein
MLSKDDTISINLPLTFLITKREIAEIMGWSLRKTRRFIEDNKMPSYKAANNSRLFSVSTVRDFIWKRNGRRLSKQLAPMLLSEMIAYFRRFQAAEEAIVPTDAAFAADAELQKKITWMMKQPNREVLLADFISKMELAKQIVVTAKTPQ